MLWLGVAVAASAAVLSFAIGWGTLSLPIMLRASVLGTAGSLLAAIALGVVAVWIAARLFPRFASHRRGRAAALVVAAAGAGALVVTMLPRMVGPWPRSARRSRPQALRLAVTSSSPEEGDTNVPVDLPITLRLSGEAEGLTRRRDLPDFGRSIVVTTDRRLVEEGVWAKGWAYGSAQLSRDGREILFTPFLPLLPDHTYEVSAGGSLTGSSSDERAVVLDAATFKFTTAPQAGSPYRDSDDAPLFFPERIHVGVVCDGAVEAVALPGAVSSAGGRKAPTLSIGAVRAGEEVCSVELAPATTGGWRGRLGPDKGCTVWEDDEIVVTVTDRVRGRAHRFRPSFRLAAEGRGFVVPPEEAMSIETRDGVVLEIPRDAVPWRYRIDVRRSEPASAMPPLPAGLASAGSYALEVEYLGGTRRPARTLYHAERVRLATLTQTLRMLVPVPEGTDLDVRAFWTQAAATASGEPVHALVSVGGLAVHNSRIYLSNRAELQPDRDGWTCAQAMQTRGRSACLIAEHLPELRHSATLTTLYERGRKWALVLVAGLDIAHRAQAVCEASPELVGDSASSATGVMLAVPVDRTAEISVTDPATGWQLAKCPKVRADPSGRSITVVRPR